MHDTRRKFLSVLGMALGAGSAGCAGIERLDGEENDPSGLGLQPIGTQQAKLTAEEAETFGNFGVSVALSADGTTALVGAPGESNDLGYELGAVYVFARAGGSWNRRAKLTVDGEKNSDRFGSAVALSADGTTALVGAQGDKYPETDDILTDGTGSAYVFDGAGDSWSQRARLAATDGEPNDKFGDSVALSADGSTAIVGTQAESAYAFESDSGSWSQQAELTAPDGETAYGFGESVGISDDGTTAVIADSPGTAFIFNRAGDGWTRRTRLLATDGSNDDRFGEAVGISGDGTTAVVGAFASDVGMVRDAGSAYVFDDSASTWDQRAKLTVEDGDRDDLFGEALALSKDGSIALVATEYEDTSASEDAGSAYVFAGTDGGWSQRARLQADDGGEGDRFGSSVALSSDGTTAIVGAVLDDRNDAADAGSAYVFTL